MTREKTILILRSLGEPKRFDVLLYLFENGKKSQKELLEHFNETYQSNFSRFLKDMILLGILGTYKENKSHYYYVNNDFVKDIFNLLKEKDYENL